MGHARAGIFDRYYRNHIIQLNTQSAFLGVPSRDAVIKLAGHMSLTRDPTALTSIQVDRSAITLDTEVQQLERQRIELRHSLTANGKKIKNTKATELLERYQTTLRRLNRKKKVKRLIEEKAREEFFRTASTRYIDEQRRGLRQEYTETTPIFEFQERSRLVSLLFQNKDAAEMSEQEIYQSRLDAMRNMVSLWPSYASSTTLSSVINRQ
jgi:hypothetical protein